MEDGIQRRLTFALFALLCCSVFSISMLLSGCDSGSGVISNEPARAIAIAYDNSTSMFDKRNDPKGPEADPITRWCSAQYSFEVLAAMMGPDDELVLYGMEDDEAKVSLNGKDNPQNRVEEARADLGYSITTTSRAVENALKWLDDKKKIDSDNKYLVITTDGGFGDENNDAEKNNVKELVNKAIEKKYNVIYLSIGEKEDKIDFDNRADVWYADDDHILSAVTEIANRIFGRSSLKNFDINKPLPFDDTPMGKVIVFAQGADPIVGTLSSDGNSFKGSEVSVKYPDGTDGETVKKEDNAGTVIYYEKKVDSNLQGKVVTFDNLNGLTGNVSIDGCRADKVDVYYQADVGIKVTLTNTSNGEKTALSPGEKSYVEPGNYSADYKFVDKDGKEVHSQLLDQDVKSFIIKDKDGGELGSTSISIDDSAKDLIARVTFDDGSYIEEDYKASGGSWFIDNLPWIIAALLLLLLLAFLFMELRKPRLPNIKPRLSGVYDDEDVPLQFAKKNIQHKIWPPWTPESGYFRVRSTSGEELDDRRFQLVDRSVSIVAAKTKSGRKGFKFSEKAIADLESHEATDRYIDPEYAGLKATYTAGSSFNFQGLGPHRRRGWDSPVQQDYTIWF